MDDDLPPPGHGAIDTLILQALVRTLIAKGMLTPDEVRGLLLNAASHLNMFGSQITPATARDYVEEELAPVFLGG